MHPVGGYDRVEDRLAPHEWVSRRVSYFLGDALHRTDGPAEARYRNGHPQEPYLEHWFVHGKLSRIDGPAMIERGSQGVQEARWFLDGKLHRLDGPASTNYDRLGRIEEEFFYVHDVQVDRDHLPRIREALDGGAPLEWALAYAEGETER